MGGNGIGAFVQKDGSSKMTVLTKREAKDRRRDLARGAYLFQVTEDILVAMEDLGISKAELANRLGKSKARISQLLGGNSNMTIGTLSDIAFELGLTLGKTFKEYSPQRHRIKNPLSGDENAVGSDFAISSIRNGRARARSQAGD